jgi:hypothetical protein
VLCKQFPEDLSWHEVAIAKIQQKTDLTTKVSCFIDGVWVSIARPKDARIQKVTYLRYKKGNGMNYMVITRPDGMIAWLSEPYVGSYTDAKIMAGSRYFHPPFYPTIRSMNQFWYENQNGSRLCRFAILGDKAFQSSSYYPIIGLFKRPIDGRLSEEKKAWNSIMSMVRVTSEWEFGHLKETFKILKSRDMIQLSRTPVHLYMLASVLIHNFRTIWRRGNQTSVFFDMEPPKLSDIFPNLPQGLENDF